MIILELCWKLLIDTLQYKHSYFAGNYFFFNYVFLRFGFSSFIPWMLFTAIKSVGCCCCFIPLIRLCGLFIQCVFFFLYSCFGVTQALNWKLFISLICTKPTKKWDTHTIFRRCVRFDILSHISRFYIWKLIAIQILLILCIKVHGVYSLREMSCQKVHVVLLSMW